MATRDAQGSRAPLWMLAGVALVALGIGLWLVTRGGSPAPEETASEETSIPTPAEPAPMPLAPPPAPPGAPAPARYVGESGRLVVAAAALREGDVLALGLPMPDAARGTEPRHVKVADVDAGRVLEVEGEAVDGTGTGVRIEIDPEWLEPGRYMIQVPTADRSPLPVRRYVLEVIEAEPPETDAR